METTTFIAASREGGLRNEMRVVANNLANMNTAGYRSEDLMFVEHVVRSQGGERLIDPKLIFTRDIASRLNTAPGSLETTGGSLDVAIQSEGYFAVQTIDGEELYTRAGQFQLTADGGVVTKEGHAVLGQGGPLNVGAEPGDIQINPDGSVTTDQGQIDRIRLVGFENEQLLERLSGSLFRSPQAGVDVDNPHMIQGKLERSNVNAIEEMSKMIQIQRSFDTIRGFIKREDERQRSMIKEFSGSA